MSTTTGTPAASNIPAEKTPKTRTTRPLPERLASMGDAQFREDLAAHRATDAAYQNEIKRRKDAAAAL